MNKSSLTSVIALLLVLIAFSAGIYFLLSGHTSEDLIAQRNLLENKLVVAKDKLNKAKAKLDTMTSGLRASFALALGVQDQMKISLDIVGQTNFMFNNPEGTNPEFIVKNFPDSSAINNERRTINILLAAWEKKIDILSIKKIDVKESEQIKKDAQTIRAFIAHLTKIIQSLTPENSGLSQAQIDAYISQLPSVNAIDEVVASLSIAIENSGESPSNASQNNNTNNTETSTQTNTPTTQIDIVAEENQPPPAFPSFAPIVTPEEVVAQQTEVAHAESEVATVEEQLAQVEEQIQQSNPTPPPVDTVTNPNPVTETPPEPGNQNTNNEIDPDIYFGRPTNRKITPTTGIIIQPGPPRLIQGIDAY